MSKDEALEHIKEMSLWLNAANISNKKYQELIAKQANLSLLIKKLMNDKSNKIYTVMVMTDLAFDEQTKCPVLGSDRIIGWYSNFEDAYSSVSGNSCDINETCYKYSLIEECEEGLYNPASKRWWFEYNRDKERYFQIEEPGFIKGVCGFTIG